MTIEYKDYKNRPVPLHKTPWYLQIIGFPQWRFINALDFNEDGVTVKKTHWIYVNNISEVQEFYGNY